MKITDVRAHWLRCPIPEPQRFVSDYGRSTSFDMTLIEVETDTGLVGHGEAKAAAGASGVCASIVAFVEHDLRPMLLGEDPRRITELWERMYNGSRAHYALSRGRAFPALGRRGLSVAAIGGVDIALWDVLGQCLEVPVVQLLGGACRTTMPAYASGGWADAAGIGDQLQGYVTSGFGAVKMRVGVMDGDVETSIERVRVARTAIGVTVGLMCDAHGTMSVSEAKRFCRGVEASDLDWFEEPCGPDDLVGTAEVRSQTSIPIALGESAFTRFEIRDAIEHRAVDVVQPDAAIVGGITESMRIAHLCDTYQLELAPHLWGSAFSFMAAMHVAFASPAARILEYGLGGNPMLHDLVVEDLVPDGGAFSEPDRPGLGVTIRAEFVDEYRIVAASRGGLEGDR